MRRYAVKIAGAGFFGSVRSSMRATVVASVFGMQGTASNVSKV